VKLALQLLAVALVAVAFTAIPGGGATLEVILALLTIGFFTTIALFGARLYRDQGFMLDSLTTRQRLTLYASIGLAFLAFTAMPRLFDIGGAGVLLWIALLGLCSAGVFWVIANARRYG